jgi:tetratricopeptide (TPR) repeat protein
LLQIFPALIFYFDSAGQQSDLFGFAQLGLEYARLIGDLESLVYSRHYASWILSPRGRHDEAEQAVIEALRAAEQIGSIVWQSAILVNYAQIMRRRGTLDQAKELCYRALHLADELPDTQQSYMRVDIVYELGKIAQYFGDWATARNHFLDAQRVFSQDYDDPSFNMDFAWVVLANLGFAEYQVGNYDTAEQICRQTLGYFKGTGSKDILTKIVFHLALLEEQRGNFTMALEHAHEALEWSHKLGMTQEQALAEALVRRLEPIPFK